MDLFGCPNWWYWRFSSLPWPRSRTSDLGTDLKRPSYTKFSWRDHERRNCSRSSGLHFDDIDVPLTSSQVGAVVERGVNGVVVDRGSDQVVVTK